MASLLLLLFFFNVRELNKDWCFFLLECVFSEKDAMFT